MEKLNSLVDIYYKRKLNDEIDIEILEKNESFIIFKYKDVLIKAFTDRKEYKKFIENHYHNKEVIKKYDIITFLTLEELRELLREGINNG